MINLKQLQVAFDNITIISKYALEVLNTQIKTRLSKIELLLNQYAEGNTIEDAVIYNNFLERVLRYAILEKKFLEETGELK